MKRFFLIGTVLLSGMLQLRAQRELQNPLIDSKEAISKGVKLHDAGKYKEAITEYLKVPLSDTAYVTVLHELILSYYRDSNFVAAEQYCNRGLALYPDNNIEWYNLLADVYDDTKRTDLALKAYDTIITQNPYNYLAYFNKGITLFRLSKHEEAEMCFRQCVILNPYYSSAHYFLGQLALLKGNMVQAMLSFTTNLLVSPDNRYKTNSVSFLNTISEVNATAADYLKNYKPGKEDNFDETQEILVSKAALDKNYKIKAGLEDQIVRQLQVVMEKLEYNENDKGFWMQYYVPLFNELWKQKYFEPMVFYMFSELNIKKINDYNQKEKKKVGEFSTAATRYLNGISESHELLFTSRASAQTRYYIKDYSVAGKGAYAKNSKGEEVVTGPWEIYYENGRLKSKGTFSSDGLRTGEWRYYYKNGVLKEKSNFSADKASGRSESWFDNGLPSANATYSEDELDGVETAYFYTGKVLSVINYKAGKKEGVAKYYNINGYLRTLSNYDKDKQEGEEITYHSNGKTASSEKYLGDLSDGDYREYFDNGQLKSEGKFSKDKKVGLWNSYYIDGKVEQIENYVNGELDGEWISYYSNGKIETKKVYRKGELDGQKQDFDDDGMLFTETVFEKGRLKDIKFLDKKGQVISSTTSRKGNADIAFFKADGTKVSQGYYSKDGRAEGRFIYYYRNGHIASDGSYTNGLQEGKKTFYYANNKVRQDASYKANKANGYFVDYYNNGQVSEEGWYVDDQRQGTFLNYDLLGSITSKLYYLDDKLYGTSVYYTPAGKIDYDENYHNGWFFKLGQYDSTGKSIGHSELQKGQGQVLLSHFNGTPYIKNNYKNYKLNGVHTATNGDGSKRSLSYYKNGELDSTYTVWHPNGKIEIEGKYANGDKTGTWKYYYYDGQLSETESYADGMQQGADIQYDERGAIDKELTYKNGELEGPTKFYGDNNQLMMVFYYKAGDLTGYSYEDKTGKMMPVIPLTNGGVTVDAYYRTGIKSAHMVISEGVLDGERILYSTAGNERVNGNRVNGLENGPKKIFYPGGKIMLEENYYYGERHGSFKYFNENGTLISDQNYYLGSLHGTCKYYTNGKLAQTYTYYYGLLESKK